MFVLEPLILFAAAAALLYALVQTAIILRREEGEPKMVEIARAIQTGSRAFLNRQYTTVAIFAVILTIIIAFIPKLGAQPGWKEAVGFAVGAASSAVAGYIGMNVSVRANVRTANAAKKSLKEALSVAFRGGSVTGITIVGFAVLGLALLLLFYNGNAEDMLGYMFGASLVSLFARVGGGIYTKGADVGADLIGKVEVGIPEDDPRNPAVIADNVGDNVGDCAGMGADVYESYVVTIVAAMVLGGTLLEAIYGLKAVYFPLTLASVSVIAAIVGVFFVRLGKSQNIMGALYKGVIATGIIAVAGFFAVTYYLFPNSIAIRFFVDAVIGIIVVALIMGITDYYTDTKFRPVKSISRASTTGAGTNIITGLGWALQSSFSQALTIVGAVLISYYITGGFYGNTAMGLYGIGITATAMLSLTAIILSVDAFGPITDNAGGIAEMSGMPEEVRKRTDPLDAIGNTTKAITKGYAVGSAALGALALFAAYYAYISSRGFSAIEINDPFVVAGLFIGAVLPFFFTSFLMGAVGQAAQSIVVEVRRQFREIPGILAGKDKPDYGKCVDVVTREALKQLIVPAIIAILTPLLTGIFLGPLALAGLLIGVVISGFALAIMMTVGGAAWDNGKKLIESGEFGGKGSDAHKAAVVGDVVGDATKDTAGPAINPLIKVANTISILFIAIIIAIHAAL
ncbi:MAG: sodium-translocating pyrophosphatase [Methanomassiliicoccales archaeon]